MFIGQDHVWAPNQGSQALVLRTFISIYIYMLQGFLEGRVKGDSDARSGVKEISGPFLGQPCQRGV